MAVSGNKGGRQSGKQGGQRTNTTSVSGQKANSPTSTSGKGSRVEPSHVTEKAREVRVQKAATQGPKKSAGKKAAKR